MASPSPWMEVAPPPVVSVSRRRAASKLETIAEETATGKLTEFLRAAINSVCNLLRLHIEHGYG